ncbi:MAG: hypothetical protein E7391_08950, partial [Ruminococcaceae bacterium]|nr:hypothetical protein [Oscillospiraceae bacterium]
MKKTIVLIITLTIITSLFTILPSFALDETIFNFDDKVSFEKDKDYIIGGAGYTGKIGLTSEKDHTTGSGKSVKMSDRSANTHRIKILNAIPTSFLNETVKVSIYVMADVDTKLSVGAFSDVNTKYAYSPHAITFKDVKKDEWTLIEFEFVYQDEIVTQIGISQDKEAMQSPLAKNIYIDDLVVKCNSVNGDDTKTENIVDFENITSPKDEKIEGGGGAGDSNFVIIDDTQNNKILSFAARKYPYERIKFLNVFDNISQKKDTKYDISMMVKIPDNSVVEAGQFKIGVVTFLGSAGNGKEYYYNDNYTYTVRKDNWTKVKLAYTSNGEKVYGITLEQVKINDDTPFEEYVVTDVLIDNVTVKVSNENIPTQPKLSDNELKKLANAGISVYINDNRLSFIGDAKPQIIDSRTLVPMRKIFESLGAYINWDDTTKTVTAKKSNKEIKLTIGSDTAYIDGITATLDVAPQIIDSRTMVPVRFIAEALGCEVNWDGEKQYVIIKDTTFKNEINIYKDDLKQEIYGFGAAANHNAWYLMNSSESIKQKALKALYDVSEGIGLNIVRLEINPFTPNDKSTFNPEMQWTINPEKDVWDLNADVHQIWYMNEALKIDPNLSVFAVPWSAPSWMKTNKSVVGKTELPNELSYENYNDYATYLATWVKHYKDTLGFDVKWISIQNEPNGNPAYASTNYNFRKLLDVIKIVMQKFKEEGIETTIGGPECSRTFVSYEYLNGWEIIDNEFVKNELPLIISHSYGYTDTSLDEFNLGRFNIPLLHTESCYGADVKREYSNETLLRYSNEIMNHLNHNYSAWCYWYGVRKTDNLGNQNAEALIDYSDKTGEMVFAREYYALGQFSKFIRPGYKRVTSYSLNPDIKVTSAINPENGKIVTVIINNGKEDITIDITGLSASSASLYRSGEGEDIAKLDDIAIS